MKKKVMFLFGAGVEGKGNYDLPSGQEYFNSIFLKNENKDYITKALGECFNNKYFGEEYRYSKHTNIRKKVLDNNKCIGGLLDGYFHTIISPAKYGKVKFSKIFNYYWLCYFTIVEPIVEKYKDSDEKIRKYWDETIGSLNYKEVILNIKEFTENLYNIDLGAYGENTYYSLIANELSQIEELELHGVATTNYFKFCKLLDEDAIFLNGELCLFEIPELIEVVNLYYEKDENFNSEYLYFPFIFGQSFVKPIVNKKQIENFYKFSEKLSDADILVVFGYNLNEDDNHINAFLHSFVKEDNKKLIVVGEKNINKQEIAKKLKCNEFEIDLCAVEYGDNKNVVKNIIDKLTEKNDL